MADDPPLDPAIEDLANEILLGPPEQVAARFDALCAANEGWRAALLQLRSDFERGQRLLSWPTPDAAALPAPIGPYRFVRKLGEGGFGVVFLAEQQEPVRRQVAIKLLHASVFSRNAMARFLNERETLARMNHPAIAQLFDAGFDASGRPHFVMEYVPGEPLHAFVERNGSSLEARLGLFATACEGVGHAHQRGVIHRDLKPHNILVTVVDGRPVPKVIDFGLAKAVGERGARHETDTMTGALLGTPAYMSPEQVQDGSQDVDTRTDVYSLGVILYQVLTGKLPYPSEAYGSIARLRRLHDTAPPLASACAQAARQPFASRLRGDLDWILRRAMAKSRDERYASVGELAADVRRHLAHEPVQAGPPTVVYALRKFVRRHRVPVAAAATALLALLVALVVSLTAYRDARASAAAAEAHLADFWRLADVVELEDLLAEEPSLWPAVPDRLGAHETWLARANALVSRRDVHASTVRQLTLQRDARTASADPEAARGSDFLRDRLQQLVAGIDALARDDGTLRDVERRAEFARTVDERTVAGHRRAWNEAIAAVAASPRYAGLAPRPITGLVPLGADPDSGLQEFAHLQSGSVPARGPDGRLVIGDDTCIVLVLIPGGRWEVGSQSEHPDRPRYDALRTPVEQDVGRVELAPFLIGKYELTQGQVAALRVGTRSLNRTGGSRIDGGTYTARHPEESVSPPEVLAWLPRFELRLPNWFEWEVAARAGTTGAFGAGDTAASLQGFANVADTAMGRYVQQMMPWDPAIDDGFATHAPVGSFRPNAFGLHDVLGNVAEITAVRGEGTDRLYWFALGGSYQSLPRDARVGSLRNMMENQTSPEVGVRVARSLGRP